MKYEILNQLNEIDHIEDSEYFITLESMINLYGKSLMIMEYSTDHQYVFQEDFFMESDNNKSVISKIIDFIKKIWKSIISIFKKDAPVVKNVTDKMEKMDNNKCKQLYDELDAKQKEIERKSGKQATLIALSGMSLTALTVAGGYALYITAKDKIEDKINKARDDAFVAGYQNGQSDGYRQGKDYDNIDNIVDKNSLDTDGSGDTTGTDSSASSEGNNTGKEEIDTNTEKLNDAANRVKRFGGNATVILHEDGSLSIQSNITSLIEYFTDMADALDDSIKKLNDTRYHESIGDFEIDANEVEIIHNDLNQIYITLANRAKEQSKKEMKDYKPKDFYEAFNQLMEVHDICVHSHSEYLIELSSIHKIIIFNNKQKAESDQDKYNSLKEERDNLKREKDKLEQQIIQLTKQLQKEQMRNKEIIESYNKEIAEMKSVIDQLTSKTTNQTKQEAQHDAIIEEYKPIMKAIYQCPSLKSMIDSAGLPEEYDDNAVIKFIEHFGAGYQIASSFITHMEHFKKTYEAAPITTEEKIAMDLINEYYKKRFNLPDAADVLYIPESIKATGTFSNFKIVFKKQEMQDIEKATGSFAYAVAIYVPGFREPNSESSTNPKGILKAKAIVRGK